MAASGEFGEESSGNTWMTNTRGDVNSCVSEPLSEDQNEADELPANQNTAMAATAEQLKQQHQQQQAHSNVASQQSPFDNYVLTAKHKDSNSLNSKESREVRFADASRTNEDLPSRSPIAHPKNKVLKRKNTPATLPNVDKIYARDQGSGMGSFMEEEDDNEAVEDAEDDNDDTAQAVGGVM